MTGPEHYRHAETLLDMASDDETGSDEERFHQAQAQVHATLALAAATALAHHGDIPTFDSEAWYDAAATLTGGAS